MMLDCTAPGFLDTSDRRQFLFLPGDNRNSPLTQLACFRILTIMFDIAVLTFQYIERWLTAPVVFEDGAREERENELLTQINAD